MLSRDEAIALGRSVIGRGAGGQGAMLLDEELGWLYDLATQAPDGLAMEAGIYCAGSLIAWAAARLGRGLIVGVDKVERLCLVENLGLVPDWPVTLWFGNSWDWPATLADGEEIAFAFIDADHSTGIVLDVPAYTPRIMPGGIIVFHDYYSWKPTVHVAREVDAWQEGAQWEDLGMVGSAQAYRRPC